MWPGEFGKITARSDGVPDSQPELEVVGAIRCRHIYSKTQAIFVPYGSKW